MSLILAFIYGACVGSFLNVCIYRLPRDLSIIRPRSFCTRCSKTIAWYDNIPILSYFVLDGRCRNCGRKFSSRYAWIEFLTGLLTLLICLYGLHAQWSIPDIVMRILLVYALIVITFIDFDFYIIPNEITYSFFILGVVWSVFFPAHLETLHRGEALLRSIAGALIGGGSLWLIGAAAKFFIKKEAMGLGDVKLMGMIGAWLGWKAALGSIMIASVIGSLIGLFLVLRRKVHLESQIPFGPFLAVGIVVFMMWGDLMISWYVHFLYSMGSP